MERGQTTTCTINRTVDSVLGWEFSGQSTIDQLAVTSSSTGTQWAGTAIHSGTVTAYVIVNSEADTLTGSLEVTDRAWGWSSAQWYLDEDVDPICSYGVLQLPFLPGGLGLGYNRPATGDCLSNYSIEPALDLDPSAGIDSAQVVGGPNDGLWYVASASFYLDRASELHPDIKADGDTVISTARRDRNRCQKHPQYIYGDTVKINFYDFNTDCVKNKDPADMVDKARLHEGMGTNGTGPDANGHEARRRYSASDPANDPFVIAERLVAISSDRLVLGVLSYVGSEDDLITSYAADTAHVYVTGNFNDDMFVFNNDTDEFQLWPFDF